MKNNKSTMWFWLGVLLLIVLILWLISKLSNDPTIKVNHNHFKNEADELKRQIRGQESIVDRLKRELNQFNSKQGYLIEKAKRVYFAIRCVGGIIIISTLFILHGILNLNIVEVIGTMTTTGGFLYMVISGIIWNEVKGVNEVLKLFYDAILRMTYNNHQFEPALIEVLELKLEKETIKLDQLKDKFRNLSSE